MTRAEFIKAYAERSELPPEATKFAGLGLLSPSRDTRMIALPCGCGDEGCEGWAMVGIEGVIHHLAFDAPEELRDAYIKAAGSPL